MSRLQHIGLRAMLLAVAYFLFASMSSQAQSVIRVGVIGHLDGALARGARLAAQTINATGGIVGADRTVFEITVVVTSPANMDIAISNMWQANVIGVIGPESAYDVSANIDAIQALNVPIFTTATEDTLLHQDTSGRIFRIHAPDAEQNRALARYLANELRTQTITTIQLDADSTGDLIGFATALLEDGVGISNLLYDATGNSLRSIASRVWQDQPDAVVIYGPPLLAAQAFNELRSIGFEGAVAYNQATDPGFIDFVPSDSLPGIFVAGPWSFTSKDELSRRFVLEYVDAFAEVPTAASAAAYDAVGMIAHTFRRPGQLASNLASLEAYAGVQGVLTPRSLGGGETSKNVVVARINDFGSPNTVAQFRGDEQVFNDGVFIGSSTATAVPTPTPSGYNLTIQSTFQNARSGPGLNFDVIGQLSRGTQARVLGATSDFSWLVIDFRGQLGWLAAYLVDTIGNRNIVPIIQPPASPTPPATPTAAPPSTADLVIVNVYPERITLDQQVIVNVTVRNQGLQAAGPFAVAASLQPGGRYAGNNLPGLDAGAQTTVQLQQTLTGPSGPQSVVTVPDLNHQVYEGIEGEANNQIYAFNYIADRAIKNAGTVSVAPGNIDLDSDGTFDLTWSGSELAAVNGAGTYLIRDFSAISDVHHDAIKTTLALTGTLNTNLQPNMLIGIVTASGNRGVVQVLDAGESVSLTLAYRVYQ